MFNPPGCSVYYLRNKPYSGRRIVPRYKSTLLSMLAVGETDFFSSDHYDTYKMLYSDTVLRCPYSIIYTNDIPFKPKDTSRVKYWEPGLYEGIPMCNYGRTSNCWRPRIAYSPPKRHDVIYYADMYRHEDPPDWIAHLHEQDVLAVDSMWAIYSSCQIKHSSRRRWCSVERMVRAKIVVFGRRYKCSTTHEPIFALLEASGVPVFIEEGGSCTPWVPKSRVIRDSKPVEMMLEHYDTSPLGVLFEDDQMAMPPSFYYPMSLSFLDLREYIL